MYSKDDIAKAIASGQPGEQIKVAMHVQRGIMGYGIEVTRLIGGEEYSHYSFVSMLALAGHWKHKQRKMIEDGFAATIKEVTN